MGGWKLEVGKMALYMMFPVGMFHYFNQPENFEKWIIATKRELYPPENKAQREKLESTIQMIRERQEMKMLEAMEAAENKWNK